MSWTPGDAAAVNRGTAPVDRRAVKFLGIVLFASIAIVAIYPLVLLSVGNSSQSAGMVATLTTIGTAHVGMTGLLWVDRRYRRHISTRPVFFYALPALAVAIVVGTVFVFGKIGSLVYLCVFDFWLMYHFAKQNWGMLCLSAAGTRADRPLRAERWLIQSSSVAGGIGLVAPGFGDPLRPVWQLGLTITFAVAICYVALIVARMRAQTHPLHLSMMSVAGCFFLPLYVMGPAAGLAMIGLVHAFQYMGIMGLVAGDPRQGRPVLRIAGLVVMGAALLGVNATLSQESFWGPYAADAAALVGAIQIWHFIVDADVWRLSRPFQRQALRESVPYLFASVSG